MKNETFKKEDTLFKTAFSISSLQAIIMILSGFFQSYHTPPAIFSFGNSGQILIITYYAYAISFFVLGSLFYFTKNKIFISILFLMSCFHFSYAYFWVTEYAQLLENIPEERVHIKNLFATGFCMVGHFIIFLTALFYSPNSDNNTI